MASGSVDDWQLNKSVLESNKYMLEKQLHCDVTFTFGTGDAQDSISAHKYVLISRSPVFWAMFTGPIASANDENTVKIDDISKDVFIQLLRYIYYEGSELNGENVLVVLYCAKKYMILGLQQRCQTFLEQQLDNNNVCFILQQASLMSEGNLEEKCLTRIDENASEVLKSKAFAQVSLNTLKKILKRGGLQIEEKLVYHACDEWATHECRRQLLEVNDENKRQVLGNAINLVRFPTMDADDIIACMGGSKLLTPEQAFNIILALKGSSPGQSLPFSAVPRCGCWDDIYFPEIQILLQQANQRVHRRQMHDHNAQMQPQTVTFFVGCPEKMFEIKSIFVISLPEQNLFNAKLAFALPGGFVFGKVASNPVEIKGVIRKLEDRAFPHSAHFGTPATYESYCLSEIRLAQPAVFQPGQVQATLSVTPSFFPLLQVQGRGNIGMGNPQGFGKSDRASFGFGTPPIHFPFVPPATLRPCPNLNDFSIQMNANVWAFVVGFKIRVR